MDFKDYYEILGVPLDATQDQIKKTYRKLARKYHPDVNPGKKDAEEKFKEINEAYQALGNEEQRKKYDQLRAQYQAYQQRGGQPQDFDWQQWAAGQAQGQGQGPQYRTVSAEDFADMFGGDNPYSDFFTSIFGQEASGRGGRQARPRKGRDIESEVEVTLEEAYHGTTRAYQVGDRHIEARIPPGVRDGSRVRLAGQGEPGRNGGQPGDIFLLTVVLPNPAFERKGNDLYTTFTVDVFTAVLGGEVRVSTLDRPVLLKVPPYTQADRTFRIRGKGMPHLNDPQMHGDLYARTKLVLPEHMSEQEIDAFRQLAANRQQA